MNASGAAGETLGNYKLGRSSNIYSQKHRGRNFWKS